MNRNLIITDLHNDILTAGLPSGKMAKKLHEYKKHTIVCAVWTTRINNPSAFLHNNKPLSRLRAIEDLWFVTEDNLQSVADFAPVYASLTWNHENNLAGGAYSKAGLKPLGRQVISFLENNKITLDLAHLNEKSFFDAAEYSSKPLICSHTCFSGIYIHTRNLTDIQIKSVIQSGGIIGLTLVPEFMGLKHAGIDDIIRQIDYFLSRFGYKHLVIGSDFYGAESLPLRNYAEFECLKNRLFKSGLPEEKIDAVFYRNALDFLTEHNSHNNSLSITASN